MAKSGEVPVGDKRLTMNIEKGIHQKLKMASAMTGVTMGQIVELLVRDGLDKMLREGFKP